MPESEFPESGLDPEEQLPAVETQRPAAPLLYAWQRHLLDELLEEAERNSEIWVNWDEVEAEVRAALATRRSP